MTWRKHRFKVKLEYYSCNMKMNLKEVLSLNTLQLFGSFKVILDHFRETDVNFSDAYFASKRSSVGHRIKFKSEIFRS